jgi:hypothetical protein
VKSLTPGKTDEHSLKLTRVSVLDHAPQYGRAGRGSSS